MRNFEMNREERAIALACVGLCLWSLFLVGCGPEDAKNSAAPADRPPTIGEVRGRSIGANLAYDPSAAPSEAWRVWRGVTDVGLGGPEAGLSVLPGKLTLEAGFDELGCLSGALDGEWTLTSDGSFSLSTMDELGTSLRLEGVLKVHGERDVEDERVTNPAYVEYIVGGGTWTVDPSASCDADDFAGGKSGVWELEPTRLELEAIAPIAPIVVGRHRLLDGSDLIILAK